MSRKNSSPTSVVSFGVIRHVTPPLGEDALEWVRGELADDPARRHALDELEAEHGPVPQETLEWASQLVDEWARRKGRRKVT